MLNLLERSEEPRTREAEYGKWLTGSTSLAFMMQHALQGCEVETEAAAMLARWHAELEERRDRSAIQEIELHARRQAMSTYAPARRSPQPEKANADVKALLHDESYARACITEARLKWSLQRTEESEKLHSAAVRLEWQFVFRCLRAMYVEDQRRAEILSDYANSPDLALIDRYHHIIMEKLAEIKDESEVEEEEDETTELSTPSRSHSARDLDSLNSVGSATFV